MVKQLANIWFFLVFYDILCNKIKKCRILGDNNGTKTYENLDYRR